MDFMILYESKARELESACLLKNELEKEGFSAEIYSIYSLRKSIKKAKVIIVPHLYDDEQVYQFVCKYKSRKCKVINLQYEQVMARVWVDLGFGCPKGEAKNAVIFAWGEHEKSRYNNECLPHCFIVGCLPMDLNLPKYDKFFHTKDEMIRKYGFDKNRRILLFISSFTLATVSDEYIEQTNLQEHVNYIRTLAGLERKSRPLILEYLERIAKEEKFTVIYRPHIAEREDNTLINLSKRVDHFHVIADDSVRQWIRIADKTVTWISTSMSDVFYAGKTCILLRPISISPTIDVPYLVNASTVSSYSDLIKELNQIGSFPVVAEDIFKVYANTLGKACLPNVIDACKEVYNSPQYEHEYKALPQFRGFKRQIKTFVVDLLFELSRFVDLTNFYKLVLKNNPTKRSFFIDVISKELYQSHQIIKKTCQRLANE